MKGFSHCLILSLALTLVESQITMEWPSVDCTKPENVLCKARAADCTTDLKVILSCPQTCGLCGGAKPPTVRPTPMTQKPTTTPTTTTRRPTPTAQRSSTPTTSTTTTTATTRVTSPTTTASTTPPFTGNLTLAVTIKSTSDQEIRVTVYAYGTLYPANMTNEILQLMTVFNFKDVRLVSSYYTHGYAANDKELKLSKLEWNLELPTANSPQAVATLSANNLFASALTSSVNSKATPVYLYKMGDFKYDITPIKTLSQTSSSSQGYVWTDTDTIVLASVLGALALIALLVAATIGADRWRHKKKLDVALREKQFQASQRF